MADLLGLSRAEQEGAKMYFRLRLLAHAATLAFAVVALFVDAPATYVLAVLAVGSEGAAWGLRFWAHELNGRAERGRRRAVLTRALGADPDPVDTAAIVAEFSKRAERSAARWTDADYWSSTTPPGPGTLRENLQESAFWSCSLYRTAARKVLLRLAAAMIAACAMIALMLAIEAGQTAETAARVVAVVMACLISADELGLMTAYFAAAREAERTVGRLDHIDMSQTGQAMAVWGDYCSATATAAPIPTRIYEKNHDRIDAAWRGRAMGP